jgi:small-conductance mechanosensitive channel
VLEWLKVNWSLFIVPVIVFLAFCIIAIWIRKILYDRLRIWFAKSGWEGRNVVLETFRTPFLHWCLLLGAYVAIFISALSPEGTEIAGKVLASLFIISLGWPILSIADKLIRIYINRLKIPPLSIRLIISVVRIVIISVSLLMIVDVWGAPVTALLLLIGALILVVVVASRDTLLEVFASFQLTTSDTIKTGDYVKL